MDTRTGRVRALKDGEEPREGEVRVDGRTYMDALFISRGKIQMGGARSKHKDGHARVEMKRARSARAAKRRVTKVSRKANR